MEIGPCRRMQRRTYPFAFVILSPGSKIGHTPRKNPSAPMGAAATSRINAYRGWCRTPVLHQPFAAKKYDTTIYRKLQVFFQQIVKYFLKNSAFCRNSLSRPFPAFFLWGYHLLPWYIIHVPAQKARQYRINSKCQYGERGAAAAKPKAQIILCVLSSILATQMPCRSRRSGA